MASYVCDYVAACRNPLVTLMERIYKRSQVVRFAEGMMRGHILCMDSGVWMPPEKVNHSLFIVNYERHEVLNNNLHRMRNAEF